VKILSILLPVFSVVLVGYIYGRIYRPDLKAINQVVLYVFLPALVFDVLSGENFRILEMRWLALGTLVVVLGSGLFALPVTFLKKIHWRSFLPCMMFNNCGNLGLPLAALTFGDLGLQAMVLMFLVSNLFHFTLGVWIFGGAVSVVGLLTSPVNIATIAGLGVNLLGVAVPDVVLEPIGLLGQVVIPMMLFSLGVRMVEVNFAQLGDGLLAAFICPLCGLIPAVIILLVIPLNALQSGMLLLFAGLPPAALNFLLAEQYKQNPGDVAAYVLVGNAMAVFTIACLLWYLV